MKTVRIAFSLMLILGFAPVALVAAEPLQEVVIKVNGMFCPFCTFGIEKRLAKLAETASVRTDLAAGEAIVTLKPGAEFVAEHFADAIERAGFTNSGIRLRSGAATTSRPTSRPVSSRSKDRSGAQWIGIASVKTIGSEGDGLGEFIEPMSIAFAPEGWFVVTDAGNARVQQFHADGSPWREWSVSGDGETPLSKPVGLAVGPQGDIWVSDYDADTISHYGPDGMPRGVFGRPGQKPGEFDAPSGIAVTSEGDIAVTDFFNHRVEVFKPDGTFVREMGAQGMLRRVRSAGLNYPTRVTASPDGTLWVADAYNYRVVAFDREGNLIKRLGKKGGKPGQFDVSAGIALLPGERLAIVDFMNHRIQLWTTEGKFLADHGAQGSGPGEFERPTDVALAPDGKLYVVDWGNDRLQVFSLEGKKR